MTLRFGAARMAASAAAKARVAASAATRTALSNMLLRVTNVW
jgi:hypothetical protein